MKEFYLKSLFTLLVVVVSGGLAVDLLMAAGDVQTLFGVVMLLVTCCLVLTIWSGKKKKT